MVLGIAAAVEIDASRVRTQRVYDGEARAPEEVAKIRFESKLSPHAFEAVVASVEPLDENPEVPERFDVSAADVGFHELELPPGRYRLVLKQDTRVGPAMFQEDLALEAGQSYLVKKHVVGCYSDDDPCEDAVWIEDTGTGEVLFRREWRRGSDETSVIRR